MLLTVQVPLEKTRNCEQEASITFINYNILLRIITLASCKGLRTDTIILGQQMERSQTRNDPTRRPGFSWIHTSSNHQKEENKLPYWLGRRLG
ncbi:hypothetical protein ElyMa_003766700 [Elysia marginata]|uniref:Uncharacterized protein n=1 Tax=Elysia marginata TaxID=1093978 RepID=A0AAV4FAI4_9GAST|nr:hypothetical protein ElyMa_003766700 [Elysia marginata]